MGIKIKVRAADITEGTNGIRVRSTYIGFRFYVCVCVCFMREHTVLNEERGEREKKRHRNRAETASRHAQWLHYWLLPDRRQS